MVHTNPFSLKRPSQQQSLIKFLLMTCTFHFDFYDVDNKPGHGMSMTFVVYV